MRCCEDALYSLWWAKFSSWANSALKTIISREWCDWEIPVNIYSVAEKSCSFLRRVSGSIWCGQQEFILQQTILALISSWVISLKDGFLCPGTLSIDMVRRLTPIEDYFPHVQSISNYFLISCSCFFNFCSQEQGQMNQGWSQLRCHLCVYHVWQYSCETLVWRAAHQPTKHLSVSS